MIDERVLADPGRCPSCAALLPGAREACPVCGLTLAGVTAGRLWQVCVEAAALLQERARLIQALRAEGGTGAYAAPLAPSVLPGASAAGPRTRGAPGAAGPVRAPADPRSTPAVPRPEWTPRRVQNLLLALGVGLLAVAAVIFVAVSWGRLGVGGRAAVMTGVTASAAIGAHRVARRGLTATAEALSLLAVALGLLDCAGAWASNLAGLRERPGLVVAAGSVALVAVLAGAGSHVLRTRALRLSAAVLGQLAVPLTAAHLAGRTEHPGALWSALLAAQAVAAVAVAAGWIGARDTRDARIAVSAGGAVAGLAATAAGLVAAYLESGSLVVGTAVLLVISAGTAVTGELVRPRSRQAAAVLAGLAAALTVSALWAPFVDQVPSRWLPAVLAGVALALLTASSAVPLGRRRPVAAVLLAATWLPVTGAAQVVVVTAVGRLRWPDHAWSGTAESSRSSLLAVDLAPDLPGAGHLWPAVLVLLVAAAAAVAAPLVDPPLRWTRPATAPALVAAVLPSAAALDLPYAGAIALDLVAASALLAGGVVLARRRAGRVEAGALAGSGLALLGLGVAWAFATATATLAALPVAAAALLGAVAATHGTAGLRGPRVCAGAGAVLLLVGEAAAATRHGGAGWPATGTVAGLLLLAAALTAGAVALQRAPRSPFWTAVVDLLALAVVVSAVASVASSTWWRGAGPAGIGLAVAVTVAMLVAVTTAPVPGRLTPALPDLRALLALVGVLATTASAADADRLWLALLALGVGAGVLAVRADTRVGWLAGSLLTASSWVRLADAQVDAPEPYTVPAALALLVVGRRRRASDPTYRSWNAYAPGLLLALAPSLLRAVTDAGTVRPLLLGAAALTVVAVGVGRRLQAPLLIGGGVLATDAVVQLAPYLSAVYDAVPRWVTIGTVGLLLLVAGATYEQRVRDLRRVGDRVARFG